MAVRLTQNGTIRQTQSGVTRITQDGVTLPPTLLIPVDNASVNFNDGEAFTWTHNGQGTQQAFAFRRQTLIGPWEWWNGTGWQATEIFIVSSTGGVTIPAGSW